MALPFGSAVKNEEAILRNTYVNAQLILQEEEKLIDIASDSHDHRSSKKKGKRSIEWNIPVKEPGQEDSKQKGKRLSSLPKHIPAKEDSFEEPP